MSESGSAPGVPQLARTMRPRHVSMIAIGGIIGAGLFVGSSVAINVAGPAVILSYVLAGALVLLVMRMLSEMAVARPGVQSFPEFARLGLGEWAGFVTGWLYWYFWIVVVTIEAIAGAIIVDKWFPGFEVWEIAAVLMALLTGTNLFCARTFGEFEFWFSSIKVAAIVVFILVTAAFAFGLAGDEGMRFANLTRHGGFAPHGWGAVLAAVTTVIFSMIGAEIATVAAIEAEDPGKTVARLSSILAVRILLFYILSVLLIVIVAPWTVVVPGFSPFTSALEVMNIPGAGLLMDAVVLVAVLSCLNSGLYVTSRVLFTLAGRGHAPQALVKLGRKEVPVRAILFGAFFSYLALVVSIVSPDTAFGFLVNASGALMMFVYMLIAAAQIRLRPQLEREAPGGLKVKMWLHPWGSLFTMAGMAGILVAMALTPELSSQFTASLVIVLISFAAFLLLRLLRRSLPAADGA